jgi:phytoene dehydrogenase-like protein
LFVTSYYPQRGTPDILIETNFQKSFAERCFSLIDEYAPGFSSSVVGYDMLTPPDLEREFGLTGNLFAWYT